MTKLAHDYPELASVKPPTVVDLLAEQAIRSHPMSRTHRAKWIRAVRYLRRRNLWVLDRNTRTPDWKASEEIA